MNNTTLFHLPVVVVMSGIVAVLANAGCGSNSSVTATIPRTPTPAALRQLASPVPTATAIPDR